MTSAEEYMKKYKDYDFEPLFKDYVKDPAKNSQFPNELQLKMDAGNWKEGFNMNPNYEKNKAAVEREVASLKELLGEKEVSGWEWIGSTSIKGMPGLNKPDLLLYLNNFPPTNAQVFSLAERRGYFFKRFCLSSQSGDLVFSNDSSAQFLGLKNDENEVNLFVVHLMPKDNPAGKKLARFRDEANSNKEIFEAYRKIKLDAYNGEKSGASNRAYKTLKNQRLEAEINFKINFDS